MEVKKWMVKKAMAELAETRGQFTQYELHTFLEELLGRELTQGEKVRATMIARTHADIVEEKYNYERRTKIYFFML